MKKEAISTAANKNNNMTKLPNTIPIMAMVSFLSFFTPIIPNIRPAIPSGNDK